MYLRVELVDTGLVELFDAVRATTAREGRAACASAAAGATTPHAACATNTTCALATAASLATLVGGHTLRLEVLGPTASLDYRCTRDLRIHTEAAAPARVTIIDFLPRGFHQAYDLGGE